MGRSLADVWADLCRAEQVRLPREHADRLRDEARDLLHEAQTVDQPVRQAA